jgi:uncharacterized membrane protein YphA (DoxX/SURF4 family)
MRISQILRSKVPSATVLIWVKVGWVFMSEGIQQFLYPEALGVGRFAKLGIPAPQFFGLFVGVVEIVCGALILPGLLTRLASIPLLIDILVAIMTTEDSDAVKSRMLGRDARSPDRLLYVAEPDISTGGRFRYSVVR